MKTQAQQKTAYILKSKNWIIFGVICGACVAGLLVVGAFCDWQISWALAHAGLPAQTTGQYYSNNVYANFIEVMGVPVLEFILSAAMLVVFFNTLRVKQIIVRCMCASFSFLLAFLFAFVAFGSDMFHFLEEVIFGKRQHPLSTFKGLSYLISIVLAIGFITAVMLGFRLISPHVMQLLMKWVYIVFFSAFFGYFFIEIIKNEFPRMRFRAIIAFEAGNKDSLQQYFHHWYELGYNPSDIHILDDNTLFHNSGVSKGDQFKSFPSGHVSYSAVTLSLCTLPMIVPKFNNWKYKLLWWGAPLVWTFMVILGRVAAGAHYFSDGIIGVTITLLAVLIAYILLGALPYTKKLDVTLTQQTDMTTVCQTMIPLIVPAFLLILELLLMNGIDWSKLV